VTVLFHAASPLPIDYLRSIKSEPDYLHGPARGQTSSIQRSGAPNNFVGIVLRVTPAAHDFIAAAPAVAARIASGIPYTDDSPSIRSATMKGGPNSHRRSAASNFFHRANSRILAVDVHTQITRRRFIVLLHHQPLKTTPTPALPAVSDTLLSACLLVRKIQTPFDSRSGSRNKTKMAASQTPLPTTNFS